MSTQDIPREQDSRLIRLPEVMHLTGMSRASIYRLAGNGEFPSPIKLSERSSAWLHAEVVRWIVERVVATRPEAA